MILNLLDVKENLRYITIIIAVSVYKRRKETWC